MENQAHNKRSNMLVSGNVSERTASVVNQVSTGKLIITGANLLDIRRSTANIANTQQNLLEIQLSQVIIDTYNYFRADYDAATILMIIDEVREVFHYQCLAEVIQAIKDGRRNQGKIYGKLSPSHIIAWIREFDVVNSPSAPDRTEQRMISGSRDDDYAQPMTEIEREFYGNLAEALNVKKPKKREFSHAEKVAGMVSEETRRRVEYCAQWTPEKGSYEKYMEDYDIEVKQKKVSDEC